MFAAQEGGHTLGSLTGSLSSSKEPPSLPLIDHSVDCMPLNSHSSNSAIDISV